MQQRKEEVTVELPPGVDTGDRLRVNNQHIVEVQVRPKHGFQRDGLNVFSRVSIGLAQSVLGGATVVPGLYGDIKLKVGELNLFSVST